MFRRRTILAVAALAAISFVVLRMLYRAIFGGAAGGSTVLWDLRTLSLPGPFSHVVIGGQVTLEGLGHTALSAFPFAAVILLTGSVVALWDPRKIMFLASAGTKGSSGLIALGLALATIPIIGKEASLIRRSLALRGMKAGFRILVPLLEKTLERSTSLAKALDSRGIRVSHRERQESRQRSGFEIDNVSIPARRLRSLTWDVAQGSRIILTGATGSGKTTVLELLAGVVNVRGDSPVSGRVDAPHSRVGFLPHDPRAIFLTNRVMDDVALSLTSTGMKSEEARHQAGVMLHKAGIGAFAERSPDSLSSGELVRAALAVLVAARPDLLLLDEPLSSLSESTTELLLSEIERFVSESGTTVVMTVHPKTGEALPGFEHWHLGSGGLTKGAFQASTDPSRLVPFVAPEPEVVLEVRQLSKSIDDLSILDSVSLTVGRGQVVALVGDNGAGKTTTLESIIDPGKGEVFVRGLDVSDLPLKKKPKGVVLVPSCPSDLFLTSSVGEELALADRISGVSAGFTETTFRSLFAADSGRLAFEQVFDQHPRDLSRGQQTALAVALQLSHKPLVVLLDEPFRGLDDRSQAVMAEVIGCVVETGTAVVVATHRHDQPSLRWDTVCVLENGKLLATREEVR